MNAIGSPREDAANRSLQIGKPMALYGSIGARKLRPRIGRDKYFCSDGVKIKQEPAAAEATISEDPLAARNMKGPLNPSQAKPLFQDLLHAESLLSELELLSGEERRQREKSHSMIGKFDFGQIEGFALYP